MVDNVSSHQSLCWEIVFFVKKICYNLTVYVTLYYTLANIDPYTVNFALLCEYIGLEKMKKVISFFLPNYSIYTIAIIAEILLEQDDETLGIFYTSLSLLCKIDISKFPLFLFKVKWVKYCQK